MFMIVNEKLKRNDNLRVVVSIGIVMLCGEFVKVSGLIFVVLMVFGINW